MPGSIIFCMHTKRNTILTHLDRIPNQFHTYTRSTRDTRGVCVTDIARKRSTTVLDRALGGGGLTMKYNTRECVRETLLLVTVLSLR